MDGNEIKKPKISCLITVSESDIGFIFKESLLSCIKNIDFIDDIHIITPNPALLEKFLKENNINNNNTHIHSDEELISDEEFKLPSWCRQQIIKLKSYKICESDYILCVGSDTVIIKKMNLGQFYDENREIINYRLHETENEDYFFEKERAENVCQIFGLSADNRFVKDYIFDVFLFNADILRKLEKYINHKMGGYKAIFPKEINSRQDMKKIGEWTLYSIFIIGILNEKFLLQKANNLVTQIQNNKELYLYHDDSYSIHFVDKKLNKNKVLKLIETGRNTKFKVLKKFLFMIKND